MSLNQERVIVKLHNKKPVEVIDFLSAIQGFQNEYKRLAKKEGLNYNDDDVKLYITVKEGCLEWIFTRFLTPLGQKTMGFLQDKVLKKTWESITGKIDKIQKGEDVGDADVESLQNTQKILAPTDNDLGSEIEYKYTYKNEEEEFEHHFKIIGASGKGVYEKIGEIVDKAKSPVIEDFEDEIMQLELNNNNTVKCKIEHISDKAVNLIANTELKEKLITKTKENPFNTYYVVAGRTKIFNGKIIAYQVTQLKDTIIDE